MRTASRLLLLLAFSLTASDAFSATSFKLGRGKVQTVTASGKKYLCGAPSSKWVPVKKLKNASYSNFSAAPSAHKSLCSQIIPRGAIKSLSQLPDINGLTKAARLKGRSTLKSVIGQAVSGTAPVIPSVPTLDSSLLFWRAGVISAINSGSPSEEQCSEFWGGSQDGQSSGQTACYMLQNVGQSFGNIIQAGTSICYMKSVPSTEVANSGAVSIVAGSVPGGNIARLFDAPSGSRSRTVKLNTPGDSEESSGGMFIRIASRNELDSGSNIYKYDLWDCSGGEIQSREGGVVRLNGDFISSSSGANEDGSFENVVQGFVISTGGDITFDTSRDRTAKSLYRSQLDGRLSNSSIAITSENELISKQRSEAPGETQRSYAISSFSGSSVSELRFLSGATSMEFERSSGNQAFMGSSEYRDTFYASAPESSYARRVREFNFTRDRYFTESLSNPEVNTSSLSCSPTVDVEVTINMSHPTMTIVRNNCEGVRLDGFNMCSGDAIFQAQQNYSLSCLRP